MNRKLSHQEVKAMCHATKMPLKYISEIRDNKLGLRAKN